ncbi:hypothetical protein PR202_gb28137 [Eleusine coracana subsp. coracana]|uniref:Fructose-bisphosphatase n=1 Tax=Eleusine coracana subsp. coracana TaxID=191504 RepID=A0AAV5FTJ0_ELECO|nr:hypothetical protein PR202_gb28137 [Eleusine coracana subsp. coracana]
MPLSSLSLCHLRHQPPLPLPLPPTSNPPPPPSRPRSSIPLTQLARRRNGALVFRPRAAVTDDMAGAAAAASPPTLLEYMGRTGAAADLTVLVAHIQSACKRIAALVASPSNAELSRAKAGSGAVAAGRDAPKPLDELSNEIILSSLQSSGKVAVMASEENDLPIWISDDAPYVFVTDPLDGSRNIEVSIPTGTIFGIYVDWWNSTIYLCRRGLSEIRCKVELAWLLLGQIYSVNDARYFDWPEGLRKYIDTIRQGKGQHPKKYSARYAGGRGSDGKNRILSIQPVKLHQRLPLFLGSMEDMLELESYGDVQQKVNPGYEV